MNRFSNPAAPRGDESVGELVQQVSDRMTQLVREEFALARAEMQEKGKRLGRGGGLFGG
ncbi:phage holin family protein, partial [Streptomyces sp. t39]|uniref:phage holin family protein n=1 Tax=Streptomyces sp. t39 TaxID=1828156 RepID=UPI001C9D41B3